MKGKNIVWAIVIIVIVGLAIYFGTAPKGVQKDVGTGPIKLGFIGALTGDTSSLGQPIQASVEIAVDEINKTGGINGRQIEMDYQDGQCNALNSILKCNKSF